MVVGAHYIMWAAWYFEDGFEGARPACGKTTRNIVWIFACLQVVGLTSAVACL